MSFSIDIDEARHLLTMIRGPELDAKELAAVQAQIVAAIRDQGVNKILVDGRQAVRAQSRALTYEATSKAAQLYPPGIRMAAVVPPHLWDDAAFAAQVAKNRGLNFQIFGDLESARAWLGE